MKNNLRKIFTFILLFITCFSMIDVVLAETAPKNLTITNYVQSNTPISFPATFRVKKTNDGRYSYCAHYAKTPPAANVKYTRGSEITDNGINYILRRAYSAKNDSQFFVYQTALWVYMVDKGVMPQPYYDVTLFTSQINKSDAATAKSIKTIVANAKKAAADNTKNLAIKVTTDKKGFTLDSEKKYYVSSKINVVTDAEDYSVKIQSGPAGTTYVKSGKALYIKIPVASATKLSNTVKFTVSASGDYYTSYYYNPSDTSYQSMTATYKNTKNASANYSLALKKTASIQVVKIDSATDKTIAGAELQVVNSNGTVVDKWTSTTEAHTLKGLAEGTYILKETKAPNGYKLSTVQFKFTVNADGTIKNSNGNNITKIEYENTKTGIVISKQDITSKKELPGATLVIKNSAGKEVVKWVSTEKKHIIKGLPAGTYTLTETIAPNGYVLSKETIAFKLDGKGNVYDKDGKAVSQIVMYNQKEQPKEEPKKELPSGGGAAISKQDITNGKEIAGAKLVVKDVNGNVIDEWVSEEGKTHLIENLKPGIYTLTETIAPNGYILSTESITFTVKDDGSTTKVVMYNSPNTKDVPVENTASFKTITSSLAGIIIAIVGTTIIVKTSKKKELN